MSHEPLPLSTIKSIIWGDGMDLDAKPDLDEQADPMAAFILQNQVRAALEKSSGTSAVLDMSVESGDVDEDAPLYKMPRIVRYDPGALAKASRTSDERFARLTVQLQRFFGDHTEECDEAIEICKRAREEARAEAIAAVK